ncbi:hypothetical protein SAMN05444395_101759 [Flavobacterium fryxellicola]|uniref:Uncharacterized protein n=1 Tax=Flavobacterium fryxellicola TaxID=249352 RepID=A0A168AAN4_9FLAO|nr:hypothetical protein [Flavobacterium fryxellicola]OAB31287.1 hypothetical protein FBFR_00140 [Flavobacterium fryxellicola]SHN55129.1 hypothetical protein SAMN05444395_101759 [Flavobacterium fryxellicola]
MKNLYLILLFVTGNIYCQNISDIKNLDTIFVYFKENSLQVKTVLPANNKGFRRWYIIKFEEKNTLEYLQFWVSDYPSSERREMGIKSDYRLVKKSYLRRNKKKTISVDFFKKYGVFNSTYEAFRECKVIYIIDKSEAKNRRIPIYEVSISSSFIMGE